MRREVGHCVYIGMAEERKALEVRGGDEVIVLGRWEKDSSSSRAPASAVEMQPAVLQGRASAS